MNAREYEMWAVVRQDGSQQIICIYPDKERATAAWSICSFPAAVERVFVSPIARSEERKRTIEECAKIADEHKGAASRERWKRGSRVMRFASDEAKQSVMDEERGETIASEMIAKDIRSLDKRQDD